MMGKTLCIITIGQSPRVDMVTAITKYMPSEIRVVEKGVLDDLSAAEILAIAPQGGQETLVSRLRDGSSVTLGKEYIMAALEKLIADCQKEDIDMTLLACTGKFEPFQSTIPIVYPDYLLSHVVKGVFRKGQLGIVVPLLEQQKSIMEKWNDAGISCSVLACSPYDFQAEKLISVAKEMDNLPVKAIVLDCMGYTEDMKRLMMQHTSKPVLVARNVVFSALAEIL